MVSANTIRYFPTANSSNGNVVIAQNIVTTDGSAALYDAANCSTQFSSTSGLRVIGWTAISGGVSKYVYKINDGEWSEDFVAKTVQNGGTEYTTLPQVVAGSACSSVIDENGSYLTNGEFKFTIGIGAYSGQSITVTVAAVGADGNYYEIVVVSNLFVN